MSRLAAAVTALLLLALVVAAPASARHRKRPYIAHVQCVHACLGHHHIAPGATLRLRGYRFSRGMRAAFRNRHGRRQTAPARVVSTRKATVLLPDRARVAVLFVRDRHGRRSNRIRRPFRVVRPQPTPSVPAGGTPTATAFDGSGMWIWYVSRSSGGDPSVIAQQALSHGVSTLFIKSSDGSDPWAQFSPELVATLKADGLHVCAWQYVYGTHPVTEAQLGAQAVANGADCLAIDAETEYQGRYSQAQQYITALRQAIGPDFPVALTSFPYVDYHPHLPYSVFLGPGGAQFDAPQIYWKEIGGGVDAVVDHSYRYNRPYGRPIVPLGQVYDDPPLSDIARFRQLVSAEGSAGVSWWDWQHASEPEWETAGAQPGPLTTPAPAPDFATLAKGDKGDLVIWLQEHLNGAGQAIPVDGDFGALTEQAVDNVQLANGLPATGIVDTATWTAVLRYTPAMVDWTASSRSARAARTAGAASAPKPEISVHGRGG
jgi:hypothetical protein